MIPAPGSSLAHLVITEPKFLHFHKRDKLTFEQYFTALQETQLRSLTSVLNGSLKPTQAKQLSHVLAVDSLQIVMSVRDYLGSGVLTQPKQLALLHGISPCQRESLREQIVQSQLQTSSSQQHTAHMEMSILREIPQWSRLGV